MKDFFKLVESEINIGLFGEETLIFSSKNDAKKAIAIAEGMDIWTSVALKDSTGIYVSTQNKAATNKWSKALKESKIKFSASNEINNKHEPMFKVEISDLKKAAKLAESCFVETSVIGSYISTKATQTELRAWEKALQENDIAYSIVEQDNYEPDEEMISLRDLQTIDPGLANRVRYALGKKTKLAPAAIDKKPVLRDNIGEAKCDDGDCKNEVKDKDESTDVQERNTVDTPRSKERNTVDTPRSKERNTVDTPRSKERNTVDTPRVEKNSDKDKTLAKKESVEEQKRISRFINVIENKNWNNLTSVQMKKELCDLVNVCERATGKNKVVLESIINKLRG